MSDPFNVDQLTDKQKKALQVMIKRFKEMSDEKQESVIDRMNKKDEDVADFLSKVVRVQDRSEKIDQLADKIIDRVS
ncbi:hypothetical protein [Salinibacter ruber]|jgi:hypothetical protein|uniref:hypothetical protein n=1 Tax=Salinibacter ruber TaxID=146919 RepID=UPI000E57993B|nr:hypothetical protein [Salinibacter ruber]MCS3685402.1 hypothetical protein [Salinibacter ruber]MCS3708062.1 hypothetical protein [Salinibacter ruber]MCS3856432.1 hypothetical protein [Salinibacter ruber]MCS4103219.1 hypothetical protein [Salinibacter ruber]MCS4142207.1 hypothetical protein [Salinibacter ruber]